MQKLTLFGLVAFLLVACSTPAERPISGSGTEQPAGQVQGQTSAQNGGQAPAQLEPASTPVEARQPLPSALDVAWSPDGRRLAVKTEQGLQVFTLATGTVETWGTPGVPEMFNLAGWRASDQSVLSGWGHKLRWQLLGLVTGWTPVRLPLPRRQAAYC